jgi:hypothetical protein
MWGGHYVFCNDHLSNITRTEDLLGLSTYSGIEESDLNNPDYQDCLDKVKFIYDNSKCWKRLNVWEEAKEYFEVHVNNSVKYDDYLVNHTKKLAIDLADYYNQSKVMSKKGTYYSIDAIPVLTETGGGTEMALLEGIIAETTEQLAGEWCGDLLQIVKKIPDGYSLINCCFAEIQSKTMYSYKTFGVNKDGLILINDKGDLLNATKLNFFWKRGPVHLIQAKKTEKGITFSPFISVEG